MIGCNWLGALLLVTIVTANGFEPVSGWGLSPSGYIDSHRELRSRESAEWRQRTDTLVRLATAPLHKDVAQLTSVVSIGVVNGAPEYQFAYIAHLLPARDGTLWVIDGSPLSPARPEVRRYDARGQFIARVGAVGSGPGEYRTPSKIVQLPSGEIVLWQSTLRRIGVYSETGTPIRSVNMPRLPPTSGTDAVVVGPQGDMYFSSRPPFVTGDNLSPERRITRGIFRLSPNGALDTIPAPSDLPKSAYEPIIVGPIAPNGNRSGTIFETPYAPRAIYVWSQMGYWITSFTGSYSFELRVPRLGARDTPVGAPMPRGAQWRIGDPVISVRRSIAPIPISAAERREQTEFLAASIQSTPGIRSGDLLPIPAAKPPIVDIRVARDGRIWVQVSAPSERYSAPQRTSPSGQSVRELGWSEPTVFDVFETDCTYVGRVAVPIDTRLLVMHGDTAWGVTRTADGIEFAKRFRIDWR